MASKLRRVKKGGRRRRWKRRVLVCLLLVLALAWPACLVLSLMFPFPQEQLREARRAGISTVVLDRQGGLLRAFIGKNDQWMIWRGLDEIGPHLVEATVAVEDKRFYSHPGVDPLAIARATWTNVTRWRTVSGASTITMQLVRRLEDRPRTLVSKVVEAFRALQLEGLLDKKQILEWYLNLAPYGGNLVGVEAASLSYFRKRARDLTLAEAALLAGLPQAPSRLRPDRHPGRAKARRDHVLRRMRECGRITGEGLAIALNEPVRVRRTPFPFSAPHFARLVRERNPGRGVLRTTLDRRIQALSENAVREAVDGLRGAGISNGAVVVIENADAAVRALVGSCDFSSEEDQGQVNGATAPRSPGSALKPFTYALAFERGICTPALTLADVPSSYTGYEPENYDQLYHGPVTAREALSASLNIPAVRLLNGVGHADLLAFLRELGLTTLKKDAGHYGLALTLGSAEVTLLELTHAYATLARLGLHRPYRLLEDQPLPPGRRVLSEGAAYVIADVLSDTGRLGGRPLWRSEQGQIRMAWKTGTSYGHRDAWTVAYTPDYTVGVWLGNFSGKPARDLVGIRAAAPVAARILDQIYGRRSATWFAAPESVGTRAVCALSGMPPGDHCKTVVGDLYVRGRSSERPCSVHAAVKIDTKTGTRLCRRCARGRDYAVEAMQSWPVELAAWLRQHGRGHDLLPPHFPECTRRHHEEAPPRVLSPATGQTYALLEKDGGARQKLLLKAASRMERLYWFVDGTLHTTSAPLEPAFWPLERGTHTIVCSDDAGRSSSAVIEVR